MAVAPVVRSGTVLPPDRAFRRPVVATLVLLAAVAGTALAVNRLRAPVEALAPRYSVTEVKGATDPMSAAKVLPSGAAAVVSAAEVPFGAVHAPAGGDAGAPTAVTPAPRPARSLQATPAPTAQTNSSATVDMTAFGTVVEVAPPAAPAQVAVFAPPLTPPARPAPDRWEQLEDALARCPAGLLAGTVCQQALRLEHCEGSWGHVASCPARSERDYGN